MADEVAKRDVNRIPVGLAVTNDGTQTIKMLRVDPTDGGVVVHSTTGSSIGGGNSTYSNVQGDFTATANSGAKTITLSAYANTVLSASITTKNWANAIVKRITSAGVVDTLPMTTVSFAANVLTLSDMTANFAAGDTVAVFVPGNDKAFDETNDASKTEEQFAAQAEDNVNNVMASADKPLATSTYSWTRFQNLGANATLNVKASTGNVFSLYATNLAGATRYLQLHNTATTPSGGATPIYSFRIPVGGDVYVDGAFFGMNGMNFATGIAFACSTTETTYTAATATDHSTYIQYK